MIGNEVMDLQFPFLSWSAFPLESFGLKCPTYYAKYNVGVQSGFAGDLSLHVLVTTLIIFYSQQAEICRDLKMNFVAPMPEEIATTTISNARFQPIFDSDSG